MYHLVVDFDQQFGPIHLKISAPEYETDLCGVQVKNVGKEHSQESDSGTSSSSSIQAPKRARKNNNLGAVLPPCRICGEKASGFHYGQNTCEACKGFFRRSLRRSVQYLCSGTGHCAILPGRRSSCAACRFNKCISLGMSKDAIRTGRYTHSKRAKDIEEVKLMEKEQQMKQAGLLPHTSKEKEHELESIYKHLADAFDRISVYSEELIASIPESEAKYLEKRAIQHEVFGPLEPVPREVYRHIYTATGLDVDGRLEMVKSLVPIMEDSISRFIYFARRIPGFRDLPSNDQISILKAARYGCWVLAAHKAVNVREGLYTNMGRYTMSMADMMKLDDKEFVTQFFSIAARLQRLNLSRTEMALLQAISMMFTDRLDLTLEAPEMVEKFQLNLVESLNYYLKKHHPNDPLRIARMIQCLTELRTGEFKKSRVEEVIVGYTDLKFPPLSLDMWSS